MNPSATKRIEARPTWYRGTLMRSRLEASAAGLLDELGMPWAYEPCCFASGLDQYLPDFELFPGGPSPKVFLEIKPTGLCPEWPPDPDGALALALRRMEVINDTHQEAILALWLPDLDCECGGWIIDNASGWERYGHARQWFQLLLEHAKGGHAAPANDQSSP